MLRLNPEVRKGGKRGGNGGSELNETGWLSQKRKLRRLWSMRPHMHAIYALTRQGEATEGGESREEGEARVTLHHQPPVACRRHMQLMP